MEHGITCSRSQESTCSTQCAEPSHVASLIQRVLPKGKTTISKKRQTSDLETESLDRKLRVLDSLLKKLDAAEQKQKDNEKDQEKEKRMKYKREEANRKRGKENDEEKERVKEKEKLKTKGQEKRKRKETQKKDNEKEKLQQKEYEKESQKKGKENDDEKQKLREKEKLKNMGKEKGGEKEKQKQGQGKQKLNKEDKAAQGRAKEDDSKDGGKDTSESNPSVTPLPADKAPIDEVGYRMVVERKNNQNMEVFIRRVIDKLGFVVRNEGTFKGMVPYYSGTKSNQTFNVLVGELEQATSRLCGWVSRFTGNVNGNTAPLDEKGYMEVAKMHSSVHMKQYIKRVIRGMNYKLREDAGLDAIVPAHSCEAETQTLQSLQAEIKAAARQPGRNWVTWKKGLS